MVHENGAPTTGTDGARSWGSLCASIAELIWAGSMGCLQATQNRHDAASIWPHAGQGNGSSGKAGCEARRSPPFWSSAVSLSSTARRWRSIAASAASCTVSARLFRPLRGSFTRSLPRRRPLSASHSILGARSSLSLGEVLRCAEVERNFASGLHSYCRFAIHRTKRLPAPGPPPRRR